MPLCFDNPVSSGDSHSRKSLYDFFKTPTIIVEPELSAGEPLTFKWREGSLGVERKMKTHDISAVAHFRACIQIGCAQIGRLSTNSAIFHSSDPRPPPTTSSAH